MTREVEDGRNLAGSKRRHEDAYYITNKKIVHAQESPKRPERHFLGVLLLSPATGMVRGRPMHTRPCSIMFVVVLASPAAQPLPSSTATAVSPPCMGANHTTQLILIISQRSTHTLPYR